MDPTITNQPEHHDHDATIQKLGAELAERELRIEQLQKELAAQQQQQAALMEALRSTNNRILQRVASLEAPETRIAEQEAELLRPQEPPPVSSTRVDAPTTEAAASDALNAAENAAETAGDGTVVVVMEEARRHLADLEPKGAVEARLAVTAFADSRVDDGNVATLLTSACHRPPGV